MTDTPPITEALRRLSLGLESLCPIDAAPAWAEIVGPFDDPGPIRWHEGVEGLIGFHAPAECTALAVVANGWGRGMESGPPGSVGILQPGERRRIRVTCVVARTGQRVGHLRSGSQLLIDQPPEEGRLLDCLLRAFGLPTKPPAVGTDWLMAALWLANIEGVARDDPSHRLTWAEVARLHPAMDTLEEAGVVVPLDQLHVALRAAAKAWNWTTVLERVGTPGWLADQLPPGTWGWMDEGMLSRWLMDGLPGPDDMVRRVSRVVPSGVTRRLRATLADLGISGADAT